jgi:hypothetical protein
MALDGCVEDKTKSILPGYAVAADVHLELIADGPASTKGVV